ncbi:MAG TPA: AraC family transcriptional regulator [Firmicutes bacterium]|nr:AraC family transcriptional regulator [Bacillota bacterium]
MRKIKYVYFKNMETTNGQTADNALVINHCGHEMCRPGHSYGPAIRNHYLITYIESGRGMLYINNEQYHLGPGQIFVITPNVLHHYIADANDPWAYYWVVFQGSMADTYLRMMQINPESPIINCTNREQIKDIFQEMLQTDSLVIGSEIKALGLLYTLISALINNQVEAGYVSATADYSGNKDLILEQALRFIENHYSHDISIAEIAAHAGVSRSYLFMIFKEKLNLSPQQYLTKIRIQHAVNLMQQPNLTISQIARSVGYQDPLHFSKTFKKHKRMAPAEYRKQLTREKQ